ncbi:MAG: acyl-CoA thioesterase [Clostridia bacterium]|nr:acyl-CoA thioesterase [Clostridia bacterium]
MRAKLPARAAYAERTAVVRPEDLNFQHSIFGGRVMSLVDEIASEVASSFCGRPVVTAGFDLITFEAGIRAYEHIHLVARGTRVFRTSMEVAVRVEGADPRRGRRWKTSDATLTLVALGEDGRPVPMPELVPETDEEKALWEAAGRRRELRLTVPAEPPPDFDQHDPVRSAHLAFEATTEICLPSAANEAGFVQAGWILSLADRLAGITAARHAGQPVVTAAVDSVRFERPVHVGEIVDVRSYLTRTFRTSMEIRVEVWMRRTPSHAREPVTSAYFTYVALDPEGRPAPVPELVPRTDADRRLWEAAARRREVRLLGRSTFPTA